MERRILLVDDDLTVLLTLKAVLELNGFKVDTASSTTEAFSRLESCVYQMVITDLKMETDDAGLEVIRAARRQIGWRQFDHRNLERFSLRLGARRWRPAGRAERAPSPTRAAQTAGKPHLPTWAGAE